MMAMIYSPRVWDALVALKSDRRSRRRQQLASAELDDELVATAGTRDADERPGSGRRKRIA